MSFTTDPNDPRLHYGTDKEKTAQHPVYLIMSDEEKAKGYVRPVRRTYVHTKCGVATTMAQEFAETYARDPKFYGSTYCCGCSRHLRVEEFTWEDGSIVGS